MEGEVQGPASSTDNAIVRFDGAGGKTVQDSGVIVSDTGDITLPRFGNITMQDGTIFSALTLNAVTVNGNEVTTNEINEQTTGSGVTIDSVLLKDGSITLPSNGNISMSGASAKIDTTTVEVASELIVNPAGTVSTDSIGENTAAAGVTIDGVLIKDGNVDGRDVSADGTKLDGIESGATADQTDAEIETAINNQLTGTVVGTSDTQTLTNKTIDGDNNTLSNIPYTALPDGAQIGHNMTELSSTGVVTAVIPKDDTVPQNTEGTEIMSVAITPKSTTSNLVVRAKVYGSAGSSSEGCTVAVFRDGTCVAASAQTSVNSADFNVVAEAIDVSGSTSSTTFSVRIGSNDGNAIRYNGSGGRFWGTTPKSSVEVTEIKA